MRSYRGYTFLKWAGGKTQLLRQFDEFYPKKINDYFEPFLGSGAVFFYIKKNLTVKNTCISDSNEELINCYNVVKDSPKELIELLQIHKRKHSKEYYYKIRALNLTTLSDRERASRTIYLNKTCFNGLYRVNLKGQFNVPIGRYKNPNIVNEETIYEANQLLKNVLLKCMSFDAIDNLAKKGDFIYFDPPYYPLSKTAYFTSYTKNLFLEEEQERLAYLYEKLNKRGCLLMLSNSDTDFINNLYKDFHIVKVRAIRAISSNSKTRGGISELLIRNYE